MSGENFCTASKDAFFLLMRNSMSFASVHSFGLLYTVLGQLLISAANGYFGYLVLINYYPETNHILFTSLVFAFIGFFVATGFMGIVCMSCDAIVVVFTMDDETSKYHIGRA